MQEKYAYTNIQEYDVINYEVMHVNENKNNFMFIENVYVRF